MDKSPLTPLPPTLPLEPPEELELLLPEDPEEELEDPVDFFTSLHGHPSYRTITCQTIVALEALDRTFCLITKISRYIGRR